MAAEVAGELALNLPLHVVRRRHWRQKGKNMAVNCDLHATVPRKAPHQQLHRQEGSMPIISAMAAPEKARKCSGRTLDAVGAESANVSLRP